MPVMVAWTRRMGIEALNMWIQMINEFGYIQQWTLWTLESKHLYNFDIGPSVKWLFVRMIADESVAEFISLAGASDEEVGQFRVRNCTDMQPRNINQWYSEKDFNIDSCQKKARGYLEMAGGNLQQASVFVGTSGLQVRTCKSWCILLPHRPWACSLRWVAPVPQPPRYSPQSQAAKPNSNAWRRRQRRYIGIEF